MFFDIDGTLMEDSPTHFVPESTPAALRRARNAGHLLFVNTGRPLVNVDEDVRILGFDGYICGCGTYIEYGGEVIFRNKLEQSLCREVAELMRRCNITPVYEDTDGYFFDDKTPVTDDLRDFLENFVESGIDISRRVEDEEFTFDKFVVWRNPETDFELFCREVSKRFEIIDRGNGFYENVPLGYTKATGIDTVLKHLGLRYEDAYAIGDSMNDLPMLRAVPNSIAMGGSEQLYPYVSYITTSLENDGVYNALKHYGLI